MTFLFVISLCLLAGSILFLIVSRIRMKKRLNAIDGSNPKFKKGEFKGKLE